MAEFRVIKPDIPKLKELAMIMHNLRYFEKIWHEHFGASNKQRVKYWQAKADEWLIENVDYKTNETQ